MRTAESAIAAQHHFVRAALEGDHPTALAVMRRQQQAGRDGAWIISRLLAPAQFEVGNLWEQQAISIAQEHMATAVTQACLDALVVSLDPPRPRGRVLLTGAEGEWHTLPGQMVAQVWRTSGWQVMALTPSLPLDDLRSMAARDSAVLGAVSCSLPANLIGAWQAVSVLRECGLKVLAGGRAFDDYPELASLIGADATVRDPVRASGVLQEWAGSRRVPRGAMVPPGWDDARAAWDDLPRIVVDAGRLVLEYHPQIMSAAMVRDDIDLLTRVAIADTALARPALLSDHVDWYRGRLQAQGVPSTMLAAAVAAVSGSLPSGSEAVRRRLESAVL